MYQITDWCRHFISLQVKPGDCCIDATMGNGHDTVLLCRCAGGTGRVLAFDIQPQALKNTKKRLSEADVPDNCRLILDSHSHMEQYADAGTISCITFNLGYLPGGITPSPPGPIPPFRQSVRGSPSCKKTALWFCASTAEATPALKKERRCSRF